MGDHMKLSSLVGMFVVASLAAACTLRNDKGGEAASWGEAEKNEAQDILRRKQTKEKLTGEKCSLEFTKQGDKDFIKVSWGIHEREIPWTSFRSARDAYQIRAGFDVVNQLAIYYKDIDSQDFSSFAITPPLASPQTTISCFFKPSAS
jgi:hypothetical protein